MDALLTGTGPREGWPQNGCRCASCMLARTDGLARQPAAVVIDGELEFTTTSKDLFPGTWPAPSPAHVVRRLPGGWDVTGPDGSRLLLAGGRGQLPVPEPDARPYDLALLDLLANPAELGRLRARGLVHAGTVVVAMFGDHRVRSEAEFARRCALWSAWPGRDGMRVPGPARAVSNSAPADSAANPPGAWPPSAVAPPAGRAPAWPRPAWPPSAWPHRTLIIGGGRSGKSTEAELRLAAEPAVTYVAAGPFGPDTGGAGTGPDGQPDAEWADRVARHQARRPDWWHTAETLDLAGQLGRPGQTLLIDGIGTWLAGVADQTGVWADRPGATGALAARIDELVEAWRQTGARVVAVSDQVGSGLVPPYPAGRVFRDQLGWLNQRLAAESETNLLVVAGLVTTLSGPAETG